MTRSSSLTALGTVLALVALATAAGTLGAVDLDTGGSIESEPVTPSAGESSARESSVADPSASGGGCTMLCGELTARSLLSLGFVPLSPTAIGVAVVALGLLGIVVLRRGGADAQLPEAQDDDATETVHIPEREGHTTWRPADVAVDNAVYRAWDGFTDAVDVEHPSTRTPGEYVSDAVADGFERAPSERLRRMFERVRYGEETVSPAQAREAREAEQTLGLSTADSGEAEQP